MKTLLASALALCLLITVGCAEGNAPHPAADAVIANATNKIDANIEGMDCSGCSSSVVAAVQAIDGVKAASADVATGDVKIALEDDADGDAKLKEIEAILAGLSDGKYKVKEINAYTVQGDETTGEAEPAEAPAAEEEPAAEEPAVDEQASAEGDVFVLASYKVTGMDCSGCSMQITEAVEEVEGVQKVEADHKTGTVSVAFNNRFDDKVKMDEIKDLIARLSNGKYTASY